MATPAAAAALRQPPSGDEKDAGKDAAKDKRPPLNLANQPDEPTFQLKLDPGTEIVLPWAKGVWSHVDVKITNSTPDPQSYKIKCTDSDIFRVRPSHGFVDPGHTQIIQFFQSSNSLPEANRHFFAIYHKKCTADDAKEQPRLVWKNHPKPDGVVRLLAVFSSTSIPSSCAAIPDEKKENGTPDHPQSHENNTPTADDSDLNALNAGMVDHSDDDQAAACVSLDPPRDSLTTSDDEDENYEDKKFLPSPREVQKEWKNLDISEAAVASTMEFALSLLRASSDADKNFVISPFSLGAALAIIHDGAREETKEELTRLLGKHLSSSDVSSLYATLISVLASNNGDDVQTRVASRFFIDKRFTILAEYQSHIEKAFDAGAETIDFSNGIRAANRINSFVSEKTRGMIENAISEDSLSDQCAILINAVYFKGMWSEPFEKGMTRTEKFHGVAGTRDEQFMCSGRQARYSRSKDRTVVALPYAVLLDPALSSIYTSAGDFGAWRGGLTVEQVELALKKLRTDAFYLRLPKFEIESETDGMAALKTSGVNRMFDQDRCDLSGISNESLAISAVIHKAKIVVNEEGTTAAAATAVDYVELCDNFDIAPTCIDINIDHPFIFMVMKDDKYILFLGQVM